MSKKIIVLSTSLRYGSNSEVLADEFIRGAVAGGADVEKITLKDKRIAFCRGCMACQTTKKCVIQDDAAGITEKVKNADTVVWATPVYYYSCSGQMKTLIDRMNPLFVSDYRFRDVCLLATAADNETDTVDGTVTALRGWIACFEKSRLADVLFAGGVDDAGDMQNHPDYLTKAYALGEAHAK